MSADIITKENMEVKYPFLRFQIGRMETRPSRIPNYIGHSFDGYRTGKPVQVFSLLGFGSTLARAEAMAKGK